MKKLESLNEEKFSLSKKETSVVRGGDKKEYSYKWEATHCDTEVLSDRTTVDLCTFKEVPTIVSGDC